MNEKILVVDDDATLRKGFEKVMRSNGYDVDVTDAGKTARSKIQSKGYDVILLDLILGDISGNELVREIKSKIPDAVIIIITGYPSVNTAVETLRDGAFDYLVKPVTNKELLDKIEKGLRDKELINRERGFLLEQSNQKHAFELSNKLRIIIKNVKLLQDKYEFLENIDASELIKSYIFNIYNAGIKAREILLRLFDSPKFESSLINRDVSETIKIVKKYRILVIDNDERYGKLIENVLSGEKNNFMIDHVLSEKEAIEWLKNTAYDLVLLDINMHENCIPMIEKIKTINKNCAIYLMAARWNNNKQFKEALKLGVLGCLYKPFYNEELLNITMMLSKSTFH